MGVDPTDWFDEDEWVPAWCYCEDCNERLLWRNAVEVVDGADAEGKLIPVLVCFECAHERGTA